MDSVLKSAKMEKIVERIKQAKGKTPYTKSFCLLRKESPRKHRRNKPAAKKGKSINSIIPVI